jgi:hypothetical protein
VRGDSQNRESRFQKQFGIFAEAYGITTKVMERIR